MIILGRMKLTLQLYLQVDKYGVKDTPGNVAVNTEQQGSVPELCSLESVCAHACVYRHIARCVFPTIFIN